MSTAYLTALADAFQERLVPGIKDISVGNDPVFANIVENASRVSRDPISKNYQVVYTYAGALAGGIVATSQTNDMIMDGTDRGNVISDLPTFLGPRDSALPAVSNYSASLTRVTGSVTLPFTAIEANELAASLDDYPAMVMQSHIKYMGHLNACTWYMDQSGGLGQTNINADNANVTHTAGTHFVTITADDGDVIDAGRIRRLKPNMWVDIWNSAYTTNYNPNGSCLLVSAVNNQNGTSSLKFYFASTTDADTWATGTNADNCWVVPRGTCSKTGSGTSRSLWPCGYQHFALSSGTLFGSVFGDLTITDAPELLSVVGTTVGDVTEQVLNTYISHYLDTTDGMIDTIFTTTGVMNNMLSYPFSSNLYQYQRQGEAANVVMGWDALRYKYDGKEYSMYASPYMTAGHLLGIKTGGGNIQEHYPPRMPGSGSRGGYELGQAVQFIGPLFYKSIWVPTRTSDLISEGMSAPYMLRMQRTVKDPRCLLLTGCTETGI